ncbi:hypothetical protein EVAR_56497_1 [Eumeta japonica]|uniref:Uncharacterized protein n=1 Tax=Eumeta variegata TaxID=151549 RepID=A0A4C1XHL0_EUMVA|nr:hypothetical protein EVAR_56497_1 [Eumeta japonica]
MPDPVSDPEIEVEFNPRRGNYSQRAQIYSLFEESESSKSGPHACALRARVAKSTKSIYDAPMSWRKLSQPSVASQWRVVEKADKAAAPAAAKNNNKKKKNYEAGITTSSTPSTSRGSKPPSVFVQNKDR